MQANLWASPPASLQKQVYDPYVANSVEDYGWAYNCADPAPLSGRSGSGRASQPRSRSGSVPRVATRPNSRPASRPPVGRTVGALESCLDAASNDIDLSSCGGLGIGDDLQRAKDEKLLEMLGEMAKGASDDDEVSSNVLGLLPIEVQEDDPTMRHLLVECGAVWEEAHAEAEAKAELQARLMGELRQIQDRSGRQHQESSDLTKRLMTAKHTLSEKLQEASSVHQDLRVRITDEWRGNERLRLSMSDGMKSLASLAEDLNSQILEVGEAQARLVQELQQATDCQARLQSELQSERVNTWRQSTNVVMAFARGGSPTAALSSGASGGGGFDDTAIPASGSAAAGPAERSDLSSQLLAERSNLLQARTASSEEQAELELRCRSQAQRISELNKELALEEASGSQLAVQLEDFGARARACGLELSVGGSGDQEGIMPERLEEVPEDGGTFDFLSQLQEVVELCEELQDREAECRRASEEEAEAQEALQAARDDLDALRTNLLMCESECNDNAQSYEIAAAELDNLRSEVQSEQALQRELEQANGLTCGKLRSQIQQHRDELARLASNNQRLAIELDAREATGCFRRRAPPPPPPPRPEFGQKGGGPRRQGSPPQGSQGPPGKGGGGKPFPGKGGGKRPPDGRLGGPKGGKGGVQGKPHEEYGGRPGPARGKGGPEAGGGSFSEDV